jgi:hypothetical protein
LTFEAFAIAVAGTDAVSDVDEPNVVVNSALPKNTCDADVKFVPVTVRVNSGLPATTVVGLMELIVGIGGGVMLNFIKFEYSFAPLVTPTITFLGNAISPVVTCAVKEVEDTNDVDKSASPKNTWDDEVKFVPVTVSVNAALPATAVVELKLETVGALGFRTANGMTLE